MPYVIDWYKTDTGPIAGRDHAVKTLEDRDKAVAKIIRDLGFEAAVERASSLPESGGTIELPDGTVIEVRPTD